MKRWRVHGIDRVSGEPVIRNAEADNRDLLIREVGRELLIERLDRLYSPPAPAHKPTALWRGLLSSLALRIFSLLTLLFALFWVRSYKMSDTLGYHTVRGNTSATFHQRSMATGNGQIQLHTRQFDFKKNSNLATVPTMIGWSGLSWQSANRQTPTFSFENVGPAPVPTERYGISWAQRSIIATSADNWMHVQTRIPIVAVQEWAVLLPLWMPTVAFSLWPAFVLMRFVLTWSRARRRHAAGMCGFCGYDIRATPTACPECGAVFVRKPRPSQASPNPEPVRTRPQWHSGDLNPQSRH